MKEIMTLGKFLEHFCRELEDTDLSTVDASTDFKSLEEWDSLIALSVIAVIDDEFEILLTGSDILQSTTIEDLYNLVLSKQP